MSELNRRNFLVGAGAAVAAFGVSRGLNAFAADSVPVAPLKSQFKIAVITDEISQDFDHACSVASQDFGMQWVELRDLWNKNILALDAKEIAEAHRILDKYHAAGY